jgi:hypothetical protein
MDGIRESVHELHIGAARRIERVYDPGDSIWEDDWDLLVVLDAARYDLMKEVADEYKFIEKLDQSYSAASLSARWMQINFGPEYHDPMREAIYVTGNPGTDQHISDPNQFQCLDEVWKYAWDDDRGTILPDPITDRAVSLHRRHQPERMIVHYMQPHYPMVPEPFDGDEKVWNLLRDGKVDRDDVWRRYRNNLRYVLDALPTLLHNVDAENTVITADHGNLVGELGLYGHFGRVPHPNLREVPWARTTAIDTGEYTPDFEPVADTVTDDEVKDRLRDLGYL